MPVSIVDIVGSLKERAGFLVRRSLTLPSKALFDDFPRDDNKKEDTRGFNIPKYLKVSVAERDLRLIEYENLQLQIVGAKEFEVIQ